MNDSDKLIKAADQIYKRYTDFYGYDLINGCEFLIAEEIAKATGARIKIGELQGDDINDRTHCWCVLNGVVLDPIFNHLRNSIHNIRRKEIELEEGSLPLPQFEALVERYRVYQV